MKRRILALFLVIASLAALLPVTAGATQYMAYAPQFELNSTIKFTPSAYDDGWSYEYIKIEIPYSGKLKLTAWKSSAIKGKLSPGHYLIQLQKESYSGDSYSTVWKGSDYGTYVSAYEDRATNVFSLDLSAGIYYLCVRPYESALVWADDYQADIVRFTNSFTCAHSSTTRTVTVEPTCSEVGEAAVTCDDCGQVINTPTIGKLDHTPSGEWIVDEESTCTARGRHHQLCSVCGEQATSEWMDYAEHTYGEWEVTREPTCGRNGYEERVCEVCGHEDDREIAATGEHDFGDWSYYSDPTCSKDGEKYRYCNDCYEREVRVAPATGMHRLSEPSNWGYEGEAYVSCLDCRENFTWDTGTGDYNDYQNWIAKIIVRSNDPTPTFMPMRKASFTDVNEGDWYSDTVTCAYNLGVMRGNSDTSFNPSGNMTVAEAITMAARAHNSYNGGDNSDFVQTSTWYQVYVDYAVENGIIASGEFTRFDVPATRAVMAHIFANALPDEALEAINEVSELPDVRETERYGADIFKLYRAGVLTGSDSMGTFKPADPIIRAEAAAIITRIVLTSERKSVSF